MNLTPSTVASSFDTPNQTKGFFEGIHNWLQKKLHRLPKFIQPLLRDAPRDDNFYGPFTVAQREVS